MKDFEPHLTIPESPQDPMRSDSTRLSNRQYTDLRVARQSRVGWVKAEDEVLTMISYAVQYEC